MSNRLTLLALGLLIPLSSCAAAAVGAAGAGAVTAAQEKTFGEAVDDAALSTEIKSNLMSTGGMGEVDVEVSGALVLLSGRVDTPDKRLLAESLAWAAKRTKDVANEIRIESAGGFISNASDELISARVRSRLLGSSSVRAANINVETYGGTVYLLGIARNEKELRQAAEEASKAGGVNQVVSYIRLRDDRGEVVPYQPKEPAPNNPNELAGGPAG
ncbi:MAG: BON domain-containing protein [Pseudomonadota bacterium]